MLLPLQQLLDPGKFVPEWKALEVGSAKQIPNNLLLVCTKNIQYYQAESYEDLLLVTNKK